jgi:hypothetical protein
MLWGIGVGEWRSKFSPASSSIPFSGSRLRGRTRSTKKLADAFYLRLRPFLSKVQPKTEEKFERMPAVRPPAFWFEAGAPLGTRRDDATYTMSAESVLFLRLIPTDPKQKLTPHDLAGQMASACGSFDDFGNLFILRNDDGAAMCALGDDKGEVENIAQYFNNGEIWGLNAESCGSAAGEATST